MILSQLGQLSQQKGQRGNTSLLALPLYHMTCRQLYKLTLHYDDVMYYHTPVSKLIVIGRVLSFDKQTSPRGVQLLIRLQDSTGTCRISVYFRQHYQQLFSQNIYLKIGITAKSGGLVYRPQLKLISQSVASIQNHNQLTQHYLECMKTELSSLR